MPLGARVGCLCHSTYRFHCCSVRGRRSWATSFTGAADKPAIATRAAQWRFTFDTDDDRRRRDAVHMAVVMVRTSQDTRPASATQLAAAAIQLHEELL